MTNKIKIEEGVCPICGSDNIEYGSLEVCDAGVYYSVRCEDCQASFQEHYNLEFAGHVVNGEFKAR